MTKQGYGSLGTLRQCCLHYIPFTGVKDLEKMPRGGPYRGGEVLLQAQLPAESALKFPSKFLAGAHFLLRRC